MSCTLHAVVVDHWNPAGDLPEATALHLDTCDACRARFDARFTPVDVHLPMTSAANPSRGARWALLAAAVLLGIGLAPVPRSVDAFAVDLGECPDEPWVEPVCPV